LNYSRVNIVGHRMSILGECKLSANMLYFFMVISSGQSLSSILYSFITLGTCRLFAFEISMPNYYTGLNNDAIAKYPHHYF
jgi:hypothetical protein